jgi:hypothetical protein
MAHATSQRVWRAVTQRVRAVHTTCTARATDGAGGGGEVHRRTSSGGSVVGALVRFRRGQIREGGMGGLRRAAPRARVRSWWAAAPLRWGTIGWCVTCAPPTLTTLWCVGWACRCCSRWTRRTRTGGPSSRPLQAWRREMTATMGRVVAARMARGACPCAPAWAPSCCPTPWVSPPGLTNRQVEGRGGGRGGGGGGVGGGGGAWPLPVDAFVARWRGDADWVLFSHRRHGRVRQAGGVTLIGVVWPLHVDAYVAARRCDADWWCVVTQDRGACGEVAW